MKTLIATLFATLALSTSAFASDGNEPFANEQIYNVQQSIGAVENNAQNDLIETRNAAQAIDSQEQIFLNLGDRGLGNG